LHAAWRAKQEPNFVMSYLPPYSPDLNPIERVWKLTRRLCLHNRYFPHLNGVISAVEEQFAYWTKPNETLRRLCSVR
jgi:transposase